VRERRTCCAAWPGTRDSSGILRQKIQRKARPVKAKYFSGVLK
jgi:hypothetical protein